MIICDENVTVFRTLPECLRTMDIQTIQRSIFTPPGETACALAETDRKMFTVATFI
jgi:hypothetical protein